MAQDARAQDMSKCLWCALRWAFFELFPSLMKDQWDLYCLKHQEEALEDRIIQLREENAQLRAERDRLKRLHDRLFGGE